MKLTWAWEPRFAKPPFAFNKGRKYALDNEYAKASSGLGWVSVTGVDGYHILAAHGVAMEERTPELAETLMNLVEMRYAQECINESA